MTIARLSAALVPHPAGSMAGLAKLYGTAPGLKLNIKQVVENETAIDTFAKLLTKGIDSTMTKDGRLDTRELAAFVLRVMQENG